MEKLIRLGRTFFAVAMAAFGIREHGQGYDFLNRFELDRAEFVRSNAICGDLKTVLEERDAPTDEDDFE